MSPLSSTEGSPRKCVLALEHRLRSQIPGGETGTGAPECRQGTLRNANGLWPSGRIMDHLTPLPGIRPCVRTAFYVGPRLPGGDTGRRFLQGIAAAGRTVSECSRDIEAKPGNGCLPADGRRGTSAAGRIAIDEGPGSSGRGQRGAAAGTARHYAALLYWSINCYDINWPVGCCAAHCP